jgi:hypothetical protein
VDHHFSHTRSFCIMLVLAEACSWNSGGRWMGLAGVESALTDPPRFPGNARRSRLWRELKFWGRALKVLERGPSLPGKAAD